MSSNHSDMLQSSTLAVGEKKDVKLSVQEKFKNVDFGSKKNLFSEF